VLRNYEILLAGEPVAVCEAATAQLALIEHLRTAGCRDEDIVRLGPQSVSWRGAVYRARPSRAEPAGTVAHADHEDE
jgi:hypothetical protein